MRKHLDDEGGSDLIREMIKAFAESLMSAEADALCGAAYGERSEERTNRRNGYRSRSFGTRAGTIELDTSKLRLGSCFPDWLLQPRRRAEKALMGVVAQCYLEGVSTRRARGLSRGGEPGPVWDPLEHREVDLAFAGRLRAADASSPSRPCPTIPSSSGRRPARPAPDGHREVSVEHLRHQVFLLREPGSGTRGTAEEASRRPRDLPHYADPVVPPARSAGRCRCGSASRSSPRRAAREIEEERSRSGRALGAPTATAPPARRIVPRHRGCHLVARAGDELAPTAGLCLTHLTTAPGRGNGEHFRLVEAA